MPRRAFAGAGLALLALGLGCIDTSAIPAPAAVPALEWTKAAEEPSRPPGLTGYAMATQEHRVVLYGGIFEGYPPAGDTWQWDGRAWTKLAPPASPPGLAGHAMATSGSKVLLFGGRHVDPDGVDETWEWDGTTWARLTPPSSPPGRTGHAMATLGNAVVLFGGVGATGELLDDTWIWDGATWTQSAPASAPSARTAHAMATLGDKVVLFGGKDAGGAALGDQWEWDGSNWVPNGHDLPVGARSGHAMATLGNKVILFGGGPVPLASITTPDTWQWDGTTWTRLGPFCNTSESCRGDGPTWRSGQTMATLDGRIVLFGGEVGTVVAKPNCAPGGSVAPPPSVTTSPANDTWEWDGEGWLQRLVYPTTSGWLLAVDGKALLFDVDGSHGLRWEWDGVSWMALGSSTHPPFRYYSTMAVRGDRIALFGGLDSCGWSRETWEWDGTRWSVRPTPTSPPGRMGHAMASLGDKLFLFGGILGGPGTFQLEEDATPDTWEWDGATWTKLTPPVSPPARSGHAMVTVGNKIVLFGGTDVSGPLNDTWEWDGSTWTSLASPSSPPAREGAALATWNNTVILFGGSDFTTPTDFHDTWALTAGVWTQMTPMTYPPAGPGAMASLEGEIVLVGWDNSTWLLGLPAR